MFVFFKVIFVVLCVCVGILFFGVKHTFTHSHNFFHVSGGSVSVGQCAFFVFGKQQAAKLFFEDSGGPYKGRLVRLGAG